MIWHGQQQQPSHWPVSHRFCSSGNHGDGGRVLNKDGLKPGKQAKPCQ
jgi:hypothetical protein